MLNAIERYEKLSKLKRNDTDIKLFMHEVERSFVGETKIEDAILIEFMKKTVEKIEESTPKIKDSFPVIATIGGPPEISEAIKEIQTAVQEKLDDITDTLNLLKLEMNRAISAPLDDREIECDQIRESIVRLFRMDSERLVVPKAIILFTFARTLKETAHEYRKNN